MSPQAQQDGDQLVSQQDLDKILENIQNLAQSGSKEMAERMLSELKDILDRLQTGNFAENAQQQRASRMMKDLSDIVSNQQKLLDDTFAAKREQGASNGDNAGIRGEPARPADGVRPRHEHGAAVRGNAGRGATGHDEGTRRVRRSRQRRARAARWRSARSRKASPRASIPQLAGRQQELRDRLQSLIDRFRIEGGDAPDEFEGAEEAMSGAKEAIGENDLERATQQQSLALDRLRQGAQSMAEQMMENGDAQAGQGPGNNGRDPLGRPDRSNRPDLGLSVQVPDEIDVQRAREVLDELRRRIGDPSRPAVELDYLERLIKPF